ncbi:MAG: sigma 54-interacting transcriptional regulator [Desulfobulbaceae bacterium]|nr:sigma 54-interacting transcriptional regulator [Desulfobulbaceae bacterium]
MEFYELNNEFIKTLLAEIPCGVFVLDKDRKIRQINNVVEKIVGQESDDLVGKCAGDMLNCINAIQSATGCGSTVYCEKCAARRAAIESLEHNRKYRARGNFQLLINGKPRLVELFVSAAPFFYKDGNYAVVIIDNISKLDVINKLEKDAFAKKIIGNHGSLEEIYDLIYETSRVDLPVLVQGASGTGKELVAHAIHDAGPRRDMPFVTVNCGALPHGLLESELFGHEKGAFTGAVHSKKGRFELANEGTIFLDEIGELDFSIQAKILRVLQEGTFERIGGTKTLKVDARVISATNRKLEDEVAAGRFRLDLYYRLCVVPINVPSLQERETDIPLLAEHFLEQTAHNFGKTKKILSPESLELLVMHDWPGNVRELQNVIQFSIMKCETETIEPYHLPHYIQTQSNYPVSNNSALATFLHKNTSGKKLDQVAVMSALEKTDGNKTAAAKLLGVGRATLYRFLQKNLPLK